jgi:hypothetical protein
MPDIEFINQNVLSSTGDIWYGGKYIKLYGNLSLYIYIPDILLFILQSIITKQSLRR